MNAFLPGISPGGPDAGASRSHLARLKATVREGLFLPADAAVIVTELRCGDEGCAPVETLIAVLVAGDRRVWKLPFPVRDVAPPALHALLTSHPDGGKP